MWRVRFLLHTSQKKKKKVLLQKLHLNTSVTRIAHLTVRTSPYSYKKFGLEKSSLNILFIPLISLYVSSLITYLKRISLIFF